MLTLLLLAVVQIIVEVLPISSSGHMQLAEMLVRRAGWQMPLPPRYFDEFLHLFTLLMMIMFFRRQWLPLVRRLAVISICWWQGRVLQASQKKLLQLTAQLAGYVILSVAATVAGYLVIKNNGIDQMIAAQPVFLAAGFGLTGLMLWLISWLPVVSNRRNPLLITLLTIVAQLASCLLPGVSRFAGTVLAGRLFGVSARRSLQWSWLVFAPLMVAASMVHGVGYFILQGQHWFVCNPLFFGSCLLAGLVSYGVFAGVFFLFERRLVWLLAIYMLIPIVLTLW
jgi:undecaprenyl-diphosphatase